MIRTTRAPPQVEPHNSSERARTPVSRRAARLGDSLGVGALLGVLISFAYQEITDRAMPYDVAVTAGVVLSSIAMNVCRDILALFRELLCLVNKKRERRAR